MTALGGDRTVPYPDCDEALKCIHVVIFIELSAHTHKVNFMLLFVLFLTLPCSLRDLSSPTRDRTQVPAGKASCLNHWTTGTSLHADFKKKLIFFFFKSRQAGLWSTYARYELAPSQNAAG